MATRVLMLGLDALVPNIVERFVREGVLPNFERLLREGSFTRLLSSIPAQTPANWHTIATGAAPGTHSVTVWGGHRPDDPAGESHSEEAFNSGLCLAEYIWEAAARAGKRSVVVNYAGYPPTTDMALHIDRLYKPVQSYYDIARPTVYHTIEAEAGDALEFTEATNWSRLPDSSVGPLAARVEVTPNSAGRGPSYWLLLVGQGGRYDTLLLCTSTDAGSEIARLRVGQWSEWVRAEFDTEETGRAEGAFRLKLVECSPDGRRVRLYRSEVFPTDGRFCSDPAVGRMLVDRLGPYVHAAMTAELHLVAGLLDWDTVDQALADEAVWWAEAARTAMDETGAELLYLHWHPPDLVGHTLVPRVDPTGTEYDPQRADEAWQQLRDYYGAIDRFLGAFLQRFDLTQDVVAVATDHGMPANKKAVALVNVFKQRGWLKLTPDGKGVNWAESAVFVDQNHLWINLKGREPTGVVPPEQYARLRAEVQQVMRDVKDPDTGEHVFSFVLTRDEAPMVGLVGPHIGDLVFCYAGGYRWAGANVLKMGEERIVFPCKGGNHGPMIPTYETEVASVYAMLLMAGPGVRKGWREDASDKGRRRTMDVAPTLAHLLGIAPPAQNEGRVLHELLEEFPTGRPARSLTRTARRLRSAARPKAKPQLRGDVTDEGTP